jgi:hypothetical protein
VTGHPLFEEERLADLLASLRPAPAGWLEAAYELHRARAAIDGLVARAEQDMAFRDSLVADLEGALAAEGVEPEPRVLAELRIRLES